MARIAIDAMGGDHAPEEVVLGAADAAAAGVDVVLVGDQARLEPLIDDAGVDLTIVHASEVIEMSDDPARAIREKKQASISVAARLVADGEAAGLVSAGSTGASMAAAAFVIGRLPGIARPAIGSIFPTRKIVLDSGANLECRPEHLVQFAVMGSALAQVYLGIAEPKVGLVNIGEEEGKGRDLEKQAYRMLETVAGIRFVGNVEGRDLATDSTDVFVTDGFTGNVLLKTAEGVAQMLLVMVEESVTTHELHDAVRQLAPAFAELRHRLDPESVGGGHLLGVRGVVVIAHGSSSRRAIANAISMANEGAEAGLVDRIAAGVAPLAVQ